MKTTDSTLAELDPSLSRFMIARRWRSLMAETCPQGQSRRSWLHGQTNAMHVLLSLIGCAVALVVGSTSALADASRLDRKIEQSNEVLVEAIEREGAGIPAQLLRECKAVILFPGVVRGGFIWGGRFGEGITVGRTANGGWSAPAFYSVAGGSWGLQIGLESVDVVMLVMNERGLQALMKQKFTLGGDISATAGPNTASAQRDIDVALRADIVSYARARGLFAGLALNGARIAASPRANREFYGRSLSVDDIIVRNAVPMPASAAGLMQTLAPYRR